MIVMNMYIASHLFQLNSPGQVQLSLRHLQRPKNGQGNSPATPFRNQGALEEISS